MTRTADRLNAGIFNTSAGTSDVFSPPGTPTAAIAPVRDRILKQSKSNKTFSNILKTLKKLRKTTQTASLNI